MDHVRVLAPEYEVTSETTLAIATHSIETLGRSQGLGDLARIYVKALADDIAFNLAYVPRDFNAPRPESFDRAYMAPLFAYGRKLGREG